MLKAGQCDLDDRPEGQVQGQEDKEIVRKVEMMEIDLEEKMTAADPTNSPQLTQSVYLFHFLFNFQTFLFIYFFA